MPPPPRAALINILGILLALSPAPGASEAASTKAGLPAQSAPSPAPPAIASWGAGNSITRDAFNSWRSWGDFDDTEDTLREFALVLALAKQARRDFSADDPRVRVELALARQAVLGSALKEHQRKDVKIEESAIDAAFAEFPDAFVRPKRFQLRNLFMQLPADPAEQNNTRELMRDLHRQLLNGADFATLARRHSHSQTRFRDGRTGWVSLEELAPPVAEAVGGLTPGDYSGVVEHAGGLSIFHCEAVKEAVRPAPEEVRRRIRNRLQQQVFRRDWAALEQELAKQTPDTGELSPDDLAVLLALKRPDTDLSDFSEQQLDQMRTAWRIGQNAASHATRLGLDQQPETAQALNWAATRTLARIALSRKVNARLQAPEEAEIRAFYEKRRHRFESLPQFHLAGIYFGPTTPENGLLARQAVADVNAGILDFGQAARQYSKHQSAENHGDLGWFAPQQLFPMDPVVSKAAKTLRPGENTGVLRLPKGLWVFQLLDRQESRPLSFDEARNAARNGLIDQMIRETENQVRKEIHQEIRVSILR